MYPKKLTKEELNTWLFESRMPLKMIVTQVDDNTIIFQRLSSDANGEGKWNVKYVKNSVKILFVMLVLKSVLSVLADPMNFCKAKMVMRSCNVRIVDTFGISRNPSIIFATIISLRNEEGNF